jgi:hypothetical protein
LYLGLSLQLVVFTLSLSLLTSEKFLPVVAAVGFSFLGDVFNLHFPSIQKKFPEPLLGGIFSFFIAQIFYLIAIFQFTSWEILFAGTIHYGVLILLLVVPSLIFWLRVYNPNRPKSIMISAFVYGNLLCFVVALLVNAALVLSGSWWTLAIGGLFFLLSDAVMGETTVHGERHPPFEFQIPWFTYLVAQGFLISGFFLVYVQS